MARKPAAKKVPPSSYRDEALRVQDKEHFSGKPQKKPGPLEKPIKKPTPSKGSLVPLKKAPRTGNANKANPPKVINQGHTPGSASRAVVPYKAPASKLAGVARSVGRIAGPIGIAASMVTDSTPAGAGSDKPKGPLMQGTRMRTRPEKPGSYPAAKPKAVGARPESPGAYPAKKATPAPKPTARPSSPAPKPTARPSMKKGSSSPPAYTPDKPQKRGNVTSGFSGNWVGAAPTEMQKRGGARTDKGGGLLGKLRKK